MRSPQSSSAVTATPAASATAASSSSIAPAKSGFCQLPFVQRVLPFITSLSLHLALLAIGLLTFTAIKVIRQQTPEPPLPADVGMLDEKDVRGFPGLTEDKPWVRTTQDQTTENTSVNGVSFTKGSRPDLSAAGGGSDGDAALITVGPKGGFAPGSSVGTKPGSNTGDGGNGAPAPYGLPQTGGLRGAIAMFETSPKTARKIAFVCDASGSMINKMASLKVELNKAVRTLKPIQSFSLVFFQDAHPPLTLNSSLLMATPQNKRKAENFLEGVTTFGTTDPIPGIEAAFRQNPELIYLLTDGDFPDNAAVLAKITELNKGKHVKVNTIAFVGAGDSDTAFIDLLKKIAADTGGTYRHVSEEELQ